MNFRLKIFLSTDSSVSVNWMGKGYYTETNFDNIEISDELICISGHRSSPFDLKKILFNNTSTLYLQIAKALSFSYLCSGSSLTITKMELSSNINPTETETDFLQPFNRNLHSHQLMSANELENLFSFHGKDHLFLTCIIYYINAIQDDNFENYWKSFNSLYNILEKSGKDFDKLRAVRIFLERHSNQFINTLTHITPDTSRDIRELRIREYILNDWPTLNHTQAYADTIQRFSDIRLIEVFKDTLPYRIDFLKKQGLEIVVQNHITNCETANKIDNVELLCFYVLKYSYFIRNKYFHAEKANPYFILKETAELKELHKISEIFNYFLSDFIRCNQLYL